MASVVAEGEPKCAVEKANAWVASTDYLEKFVKLSGVLAVFGYVSLRAQVNRLGVPFTTSLTLEGYLRETYSVLASLLDAMLMTSILALVLVLVVLVARGAVARAMNLFLATRWAPVIFIAFLLVFYLWLIGRMSGYIADQAIAVGPLDARKFVQRNADAAWYSLIWVCVAGGLLVRFAPRLDKSGAALWRVLRVLIVLLALHIPLLDGLARRDAVFTQATVTTDTAGSAPVCGLLVLSTASMLEVWQARNGAGVVQMIPNGKITVITAGPPADLLALARSAALDRTAIVPRCTNGTESKK